MDSLTQIVLGGAVGQAVLGKKIGNRAVLWGAIAGTIPDLDVFLKFFTDDLTAVELHRGFSHSIIFSVLFAPVLAWVAWRFHRHREATFRDWTKLTFLALVTHPLLDAHTAFGTQLCWPLPYKITYNNIFVVDPLYTLPFLFFLVWSMLKKKDDPRRMKLNRAGIIISCSYMLLTFAFKGIAHWQFTKELQKQHITYTELESKPTPLNSILWCGFVKTQDSILLGYYSLLDGPGSITFTGFARNEHLLGPFKNHEKVERLRKLSRGWYVIEKEGEQLYFNDARFGQAGFGNDPSSLVFSHQLFMQDGELQVRGRPREIKNAGRDLSGLFRRMWGIRGSDELADDSAHQ